MIQIYAELIIQCVQGHWHIIVCTKEFSDMTGYDSDTIQTRFSNRLSAFFSDKDKSVLSDLLCRFCKAEGILPGTFILHISGERRISVMLQAGPSDYAADTVRLCISDVSQWEDFTNQLELQMSSLKQYIPSGICRFIGDDGLTMLWCDEDMLDIIGYTRAQVEKELDFKSAGYLHPEYYNQIRSKLADLDTEHNRKFSMEVQVIRRDRELRILMVTIEITREFYGEQPVYYVIGTDITNQKYSRYVRAIEQQGSAGHNTSYLWEYDIKNHRIKDSESLGKLVGIRGDIDNVPEFFIEKGIVCPESEAVFRNCFAALEQGEDTAECIVKVYNLQEEPLWLRVALSAVKDEDGNTYKSLLLTEDITEQRRLELRSHEKENWWAAMTYGQVFGGRFDLTKDLVLTANSEIYAFYDGSRHYTVDEFIKENAEKYLHPDDRRAYVENFCRDALLRSFQNGILEIVFEYRAMIQGNYLWFQSVMHLIFDPDSGDVCSYIHIKDINGQKNEEEELRRHAERDSLTGLYNRFTAEMYCEKLLREADSGHLAALMMIDLDDLKMLNDSYGHICGDEAIKRIADHIRALFTRRKAILGRMGGDEFIVLIPDCESMEMILDAAEQIGNVSSDALPFDLSCSIGISVAPLDGSSFAALYKCADSALYQAKRMGKTRYALYDNSFDSVGEDKNSVSRDWLLEEASDLIYVVNLDTYQLFYMNGRARELYGVGEADYKGKMCYEVLQGLDHPCSFCTNHLLSRDRFYKWEFKNEHIGHYFLLRDRIVDWYGLPARIEFAADVTAMDMRNQILEEKLRDGRVITDCLRSLNKEQSFADAVMEVLNWLGEFYKADRAFLVMCGQEDRGDNLDYIWSGEKAEAAQFTEEDRIRYMRILENCFQQGDMFQIDSKAELEATYPELLNVFARSNIICQRVEALRLAGRLVGFIGVDNPFISRENFTVMEMVGTFISEEISRRRLEQRLMFLSYYDAMTGLQNRNRYMEYIDRLDRGDMASLGVVYIRVNFLNEINRYRGYGIGDQVLKTVANFLKNNFPAEQIFRMSGDAYMVLVENMARDKFEESIQNIYTKGADLGANGITTGYAWGYKKEVAKLLQQSYEMMLTLKQNFSQTYVGPGLGYYFE